ncbi:MAG: SpoIIE family protein phosphatase [Flavobacteriales bacterium]
MRPQAIAPLDRQPMLNAHALRIGLVHGTLAARAKWPDVLSGGRILDWVVVAGSTDGVEVDAWVLGTDGTTLQRMETYRRLKASGPLDRPVLVLLDPREDQTPWLQLKADGYHEKSSSAALMAQRIDEIIPSPFADSGHNSGSDQFSSTPNLLDRHEAERWQATFQSAGAGMLTAKTTRLLDAIAQLEEAPLPEDTQGQVDLARFLLRAVEWELNNAEARRLLDLREPVSLGIEFVDRMTPLQGHRFVRDMLTLGETSDRVTSEWVVREQGGTTRHLNVDIFIPNDLKDSLLVTLLDISDRIRLEQELREHVHSLEDHVRQRTEDIRIANQKLTVEGNQRQRLAQQVRENLVHITQSVLSAKAILEVALPGRSRLKSALPNSFVIERPRDILGGDFLHVHSAGHLTSIALVDSTGHGIPGAMVSLMGHNLLQQSMDAVSDLSPGRILTSFHDAFCERMKTRSADPQMHGFDAGIVTVDPEARTLRFSGAKEDLYHIRDGECQIVRGTRQSIELPSLHAGKAGCPVFEEITIDIRPGDQFYLSTDGVRDQFGGTRNRKLGRKRFADLLTHHAHLPLSERKKAIQQELLVWKGANAKVDDATLIGFEF